jgi:hypothetical protein
MSNIIRKIRICGVTNIAEVSIPLSELTALLAPNNYGKSNLLVAVEFGVRFLTATPSQRREMMSQRGLIPINNSMAGQAFEFEIIGSAGDTDYEYGYRFEWATTMNELPGCRIIGEWLRSKSIDEPKFRQLLKRDSATVALMVPTPAGRCNKPVTVDADVLALDRLVAIEKIFFAPLVQTLTTISVYRVNTLNNPDGIFSRPYPQSGVGGYSTAMPGDGEIGYFINSLRQLASEQYSLLRSTLLQLLPGIEDFEPVQVDLSQKSDVPFQMPNSWFDIRVKERHNNQYTSINSVSTGCKKILYVLSMAVAASLNGVQLLMFEELENSVHPRLLQSLLQVVTTLSGDTRVMTTSHSPFLVKYLRPERIWLGMPSSEGVADFRTIKPAKVKRVLQMASGEDTSVGEYLFEMMLDAEADPDMLDEYFI